MWYVVERANDNFIADFETREEAEYTVGEWETLDEMYGEFVPMKYKIIEVKEV